MIVDYREALGAVRRNNIFQLILNPQQCVSYPYLSVRLAMLAGTSFKPALSNIIFSKVKFYAAVFYFTFQALIHICNISYIELHFARERMAVTTQTFVS